MNKKISEISKKLEQIDKQIEELKFLKKEAILTLNQLEIEYGFKFMVTESKGSAKVKLYRSYKGVALYISCSDISNTKERIERALADRVKAKKLSREFHLDIIQGEQNDRV